MKRIVFTVFCIFLLMNNGFAQLGTPLLKDSLSSNYLYTSDSTKLYIKISGKGPLCIFVHGGPGMWSKSFEVLGGNVLEEKLTMVYYDQRGSGRSDSSKSNDYSINRMVTDIENIRSALGADKVYIIAHSFGGIIAVNYAKKYANHLYGLILLNATLFLDDSIEEQSDYIRELLHIKLDTTKAGKALSEYSTLHQQLAEKGWDYKLLSENKNTIAMVDSVDNKKPDNYDFASRVWGIKEYSTNYGAITQYISVPTLVIAGTADHAVGVNHYKLFKFPNQKTVLINGGHILYFEHNSEFTHAVFSFIKSTEN